MDFLSLPGRYETVVKGYVFKYGGMARNITISVYPAKDNKLLGKYKSNKDGVYYLILKQNSDYKITAVVDGKKYTSVIHIPDKTSYFLTGKTFEVAALLTIE
jgi:hypothetical protein